ncbi:hypothetical protein LWI29_004306 [Acer saccharum]|uniref:Ubiquitin-like protease family profile domain-containing protein n=1 Tax=Acer saccharum TaxID=4024 RepID=A0AA39SA11_ACESA|nr:hypothetical protein LWI29_004306 [Acer saccharum]
MDEKVVFDIAKEQLHVVVNKGEEKGVQEHFEAQVNVNVWKGEEKGVQEHFEAQVYVDNRSDNEGNKPADKVEDKCNTTLKIINPMVDMQKIAPDEGVSTSVNSERSIIVYENHPPMIPKRRSKKAVVLKFPYIDTEVYIPLNYESNHWILAEIDFIARKTIMYDSEINFIESGKKFINFMQPLYTLLPLLLHKIEFFSKRPEIHQNEDMMPGLVECCVNVPQQEKSDCRFFVIKFVKHLIHGESIDLV